MNGQADTAEEALTDKPVHGPLHFIYYPLYTNFSHLGALTVGHCLIVLFFKKGSAFSIKDTVKFSF